MEEALTTNIYNTQFARDFGYPLIGAITGSGGQMAQNYFPIIDQALVGKINSRNLCSVGKMVQNCIPILRKPLGGQIKSPNLGSGGRGPKSTT